jgi:hypothetical protein
VKRLLERLGLAPRSEVCPYCFDPFLLRETPFRCASPPVRCAPEPDPVRAAKWEEVAPIGRVLPPDGKRRKEAVCSHCQQKSRKRICPHCHMDLPHTTGQLRNLIFAVIGAKDTGKSHYIAVLIDQIKKHVGPNLDILLEPLNDETIVRYREDFHRPLFEGRRIIRGTISALTDRRVQVPLVFSLTRRGKDLLGRPAITGVVTLVFFDTAGEDLDSRDTMATVNKYIYRADGIILLLDPLQLLRVRDRLDSTIKLPAMSAETGTILERSTELIRRGRELPANAMISMPLAVAFSKFDALEPLIDPQLQIHAGSRHDRGFDVADFDAVRAEMETLLAEWDGLEIQQKVSTHYRRFAFFGLTALGCNPGDDERVARILPRRVEDPFLWLLFQHGLIPAVRRA